MSGFSIRDLPMFEDDPGDGVRFEAREGWVEIGISWEGSERKVLRVDPRMLSSVTIEAMQWRPEPEIVRVQCKHIECGLTDAPLTNADLDD